MTDFRLLSDNLCALVFFLYLNLEQEDPYRDRLTRPPTIVKANMHTFKTMLETYSVDWEGLYPPDIDALYVEANQNDNTYWKDFSNPYTNKMGKGNAYQNASTPPIPGSVSYQPIMANGLYTKFKLFGYDEKGQRIKMNGKEFVLSDS